MKRSAEARSRKKEPSGEPEKSVAEGVEDLASVHDLHAPSKLAELHPRFFFLKTWRWLDAVAARERSSDAPGWFDWSPVKALVVGAVVLTLMEYYGGRREFETLVVDGIHFGRHVLLSRHVALRESPWFDLYSYGWWSGWRFLGYFLGPALATRFLLRRPLRWAGLETRGFTQHVWIYGVLYLIVLGPVIGASFTKAFQEHYPFYDFAHRSWFDFFAWEVLYAIQFFSLEFFFRGFLVQSMRRAMGSHAIFAMVVPYCMIHYGKPIPETLAAIFAGIALGSLALRTRSIWAGFLIHVSVAVTMDVASLLQGPGLPHVWWPQL